MRQGLFHINSRNITSHQCTVTVSKIQEILATVFFVLVICPIAIAYSTGQIIKSVCVCQSASVSVRLRALTVAFIDRFLPKLAQT